MAEQRPFLDQICDYDESTAEGFNACIEILCKGLNFYKVGILNAVNAAPGVDRPLVVAALKVIFEGILSSDAQLREAVEGVLELPIASITYQTGRKGGAADV